MSLKIISSFFIAYVVLFFAGIVLCYSQELSGANTAEIDSLNHSAKIYLDNHSPLASRYSIAALESARKINYRQGEAAALLTLGDIEMDSGSYEASLKYNQQAMQISEEIKDEHLRLQSLQNSGNAKLKLGNYQEAIELYLKALDGAEKSHFDKILSDLYNNLGVAYSEINKPKEALVYHERALAIRKEKGWKADLASSLQNIGNIYFNKMEDSTALDYDKQALKIQEEINDKSGKATTINNIAAVYVDWEKYDKAEELLLETIRIRKEIGEYNRIPQVYCNLGDVMSMKDNHAGALKYFDDGLKIALRLNAKREIRNLYQSFSNTYEVMKDPVNALKYYKLYASYKDSILNDKNNRQINELYKKYETAQKEIQINLQQAEIGKQKTQKIFLFGAFALLSVIALLLFNRHKLRTRQAMQEEKIKQEKLRVQSMIMAQEEERKHLAGELHDGLGQVLSAARLNVESLTLKNNGSTEPLLVNTMNLIDHSFTELRNISHRMMPVQLIRFGLPSALNEIAATINKSGRIHVNFDADENMPRFGSTIEINVFRIVQEWLNNIIKYSGATEVSIQLMMHDKELTLMIEDNGTGFEIKKLDDGKGNGWYNINSRLSLINGQIEIDSKINKGTLVSIFVSVGNTILIVKNEDGENQVISS